MAVIEKTLKDGRALRVEIEVRPNPCGGDYRCPYLVAYADGQEQVVGDVGPAPKPWLAKLPKGESWWVIHGKVILTESEGKRAKVALDAARSSFDAGVDAALEAAVPGITALKSAIDDEDDYRAGMTRMMEDEDNDGRRGPKRPTASVASLARQYPRAALYLRAEHDSASMSDAVSAGGKDAMRILSSGGSEADAREAMAAAIRSTAAYQGRD